jgi:outer membrane protein assembly factor BamD
MTRRMNRWHWRRSPLVGTWLLVSLAFPACLFHRHHADDAAVPVNPGDQPDKILYEKATREIDRGRYDVGRLTLQTLINTYPDSEYLSKAKLAIADSYYNEGGVSGLTQSEAEYKDFITFFPTAPEAPMAQFRVGMAHFRLMAKADRDRTEAKLAEAELKEFLLKYPDNPLMPRVKARLRQVQEVLGQGEYKIAKFYYMKGANRAARSRFQDIVEKYPNFSQGDSALWFLAQSYERLKQPNAAIPYYSRLVAEFPLSERVPEAKERLIAMHQPIPRPTKAIMARAQADAVRRRRKDLLAKFGGLMSSSPDISATLHGPVRIGGPQPGEVEVAKTAAPPAPSATVVAGPVSDTSLKSGTPIDPKSNAGGSQTQNGGSVKGQSDPANSTDTKNSEQTSSSKKKKHKSFFMRLVNPF